MPHTEKKLAGETVYSGKILRLERDQVLLENGHQTVREVVRHNGAVCIVAVDEKDNLLLVRQYRYPYAQEILELPAGKRDGDETPETCGRRELEEETACTAAHFEKIGALYTTPAFCDETIHIFYAWGLGPSSQHLDDDEFLTVEKVPFAQAVKMVLAGEIPDAKTQTGILLSHQLREGGRFPKQS